MASIAITFGLYHQVYSLWRNKSAKDFVWSIVAALVLNELAWLNYGLALHEWPIVTVGLMNTPAVAMLLLGFIKYKGGKGGVDDV